MSLNLQQYIKQLRPRDESYVNHVDKIQSLLYEGTGTDFSIWLDTRKQINKWYDSFSSKPPFPKTHIIKLT